MGLEEKHEIQKAQTGRLPERLKELKELCGGELPYEIDGSSFEGDVKGLHWLEANGPQQVGAKACTFDGGVLTLACAFSQSPGGRFKGEEIRDVLLPKL